MFDQKNKSTKRQKPYALSGYGMVSSLGYNAVTSFASARAGLTRPSELDVIKVRSKEDGEQEKVIGHQAPMTDGFEGNARTILLGWYALKDLLSVDILDRINWNKTGFFISVADPDRTNKGLSLIQDKEVREKRENQIKMSPVDLNAAKKELLKIVDRILNLSGAPIPNKLRFLNFGEHSAFIRIADQAMQALESGIIDSAIIGSVDSLIDNAFITWLYHCKRLKNGYNPVGLQPGEAAAFLLIEPIDYLINNSNLALITSLSIGKEPNSLLSGKPTRGIGLQEIVIPLCKIHNSKNSNAWIISDHNGEPYRAYEWSLIQSRLAGSYPFISDCMYSYPAESFGDTGSAAGAVATCLSLRAWQRGYVPNTVSWIITSSADGEYASMSLKKL